MRKGLDANGYVYDVHLQALDAIGKVFFFPV